MSGQTPLFPHTSGRLTVLATPYAPYVIRRGRKHSGIEVDLVCEFAAELNLDVDFVVPTTNVPPHHYPSQAALTCRRDAKQFGPSGLGGANVDISIGGFTALHVDQGGTDGVEATIPYLEEDLVSVRLQRSKADVPEYDMRIGINLLPLLDSPEYAELNPSIKKPSEHSQASTILFTSTSGLLNKAICADRRTGKPKKVGVMSVVMACRTASCVASRLSAFLITANHSGRTQALARKYGVAGMRAACQKIGPCLRLPLCVRDGVLIVSGPTFYPVFDAKRAVGIDVEITRRFAAALGRKLELKHVDVATLNVGDGMETSNQPPYQKVNQFDCDIVAGGLSYLPERDRAFSSWTVPYTSVRRSMILRSGDGLENREAVTGIVSVRGGSTADEDFQDVENGANDVTVERDNDSTDAEVFQALLDGRLRGVLRGTVVAKALVASFPDKFEYIEWGQDEPLHFLANMATGVAPALSAFCRHLTHTGEMADIIQTSNLLMRQILVNKGKPRSSKTGTTRTTPKRKA